MSDREVFNFDSKNIVFEGCLLKSSVPVIDGWRFTSPEMRNMFMALSKEGCSIDLNKRDIIKESAEYLMTFTCFAKVVETPYGMKIQSGPCKLQKVERVVENA